MRFKSIDHIGTGLIDECDLQALQAIGLPFKASPPAERKPYLSCYADLPSELWSVSNDGAYTYTIANSAGQVVATTTRSDPEDSRSRTLIAISPLPRLQLAINQLDKRGQVMRFTLKDEVDTIRFTRVTRAPANTSLGDFPIHLVRVGQRVAREHGYILASYTLGTSALQPRSF